MHTKKQCVYRYCLSSDAGTIKTLFFDILYYIIIKIVVNRFLTKFKKKKHLMYRRKDGFQ